MSYARIGPTSDVYVIRSSGGWECLSCLLRRLFVSHSPSGMIDHLDTHLLAGHKVPQSAIKRLQSEAVFR